MKTAKKLLSLALSVVILCSCFVAAGINNVSAADNVIGFENATDMDYFEALGAKSDDGWGIVDVDKYSKQLGVGNSSSKALKLTMNGDGTYVNTDKTAFTSEQDKNAKFSHAIYRLNPYYTEGLTSVSGKIGLPKESAVGFYVDSSKVLYESSAITLRNYYDSNWGRSQVDANRMKTLPNNPFSTQSLYGTKQSGINIYKSNTTYPTDPIWISFKMVYSGTAATLYYSATMDVSDMTVSELESNETKGAAGGYQTFDYVDLDYTTADFAILVYAFKGSNVLSERIEQSVAYLDDIKITTSGEQKTLCTHTPVQNADSKYLKALDCQVGNVYYKSCGTCGARLTDTFTSEEKSDHILHLDENGVSVCSLCSENLGKDAAGLINFEDEGDAGFFTAPDGTDSTAWGVSDTPAHFVLKGNVNNSKALKISGANGLYKLNSVYTDGKYFNGLTARVYSPNGKYVYIIYEYTDDNNWKAFGIQCAGATTIGYYEYNNGTLTRKGGTGYFKPNNVLNAGDATFWFDIEITRSNGTAQIKVLDCYENNNTYTPFEPTLTVNYSSDSPVVAFASSDYSLIDDLNVVLESEETPCQHLNKVQNTSYPASDATCENPATYYEYCNDCDTVLDTTFEQGGTVPHNYIYDKETKDLYCDMCEKHYEQPSLPGVIDFENDTDKNYFVFMADASKEFNYPLVKPADAAPTVVQATLGDEDDKSLRIFGPDLFAVNPIYTLGKDFNTIEGEIGIANGNAFYIIYDYTDANNWKGFNIVGRTASDIDITSTTMENGKKTDTGITPRFATPAYAEYVKNNPLEEGKTYDRFIQFLDFKLVRSGGNATLTITSDCYNTSTNEAYVPVITAECSNIDYLAFMNGGLAQYTIRFIDDLKLYNDPNLECAHAYSVTSSTVADYLNAGEVVYTCSLCGGTKTEVNGYAYADINKDGIVNNADFEAFDESTADAELFSFDGSAGISAFDKTIVKLLTKGIAFDEMIDVTGDGDSNIIDLVRMKKIAVGIATGDADRNGDGTSDSIDIVFVRTFLLVFDEKLLK